MTFDEYKKAVHAELWEEERSSHECNSKCDAPTHFDLVFEVENIPITEANLQEWYGHFLLTILSARRVLEYPQEIPGTHVVPTGAWEIEYHYKSPLANIDDYIKGVLNLYSWREGITQ